jgi:hypothetical protein
MLIFNRSPPIFIRLRFILTMGIASATVVALSKLSDCMSETSAEHRQPNTPYAALHAASDKDAARARADAPAQGAPTEPDYLNLEAEKLESLKQALYAAFMAAPKAGIPTALVDLAATYTSALRLQMSLRGFSTMPARAAKVPMFATPRTK